ncbi:MAG: hypothetical protein PWP50_1141 [Synergistaceae bacterium]|jgi:hypothetical protein|nr:hypothetical protein [Synergistaceae bacterium]
MRDKEIIFLVEEDPEGGYTARGHRTLHMLGTLTSELKMSII